MIINVKFVELNTSTINMAYNSEILSDQRLIRNPVRFVFRPIPIFFRILYRQISTPLTEIFMRGAISFVEIFILRKAQSLSSVGVSEG